MKYETILSVDEKNYWRKWIAELVDQGKRDWLINVVNSRELDDAIRRDLENLWVLSDRIRMLDVGAGPISVAGSICTGSRFKIYRDCQDPLGEYYEELLDEHDIPHPIYLTMPAENLSEDIEPGRYDYVFCRNALDHCSDASLAIAELLKVLAPGGIVRLRHYQNEGVYANYAGFHRWNFMNVAGHALLFTQAKALMISQLVGPDVAVISYSDEAAGELSEDGQARPFCEIVMLSETWNRPVRSTGQRGLSVALSDQRRAIKFTRNSKLYDPAYPLFLHLHVDGKIKATTIVWMDGEDSRVVPLFSPAYEKATRIAFGQYRFEEGADHYSPKFSNLWYEEYAVEDLA
jgi:SAM-dependent methyltransferase